MQTDVLEGVRLSPQQSHVWLLEQSDKSGAYRAQCAILLEGSLEVGLLKRAVALAVQAHSIFRTTFHYRAGMVLPIQVVTPDRSFVWREVNLGGGREKDLDAAVDELIKQERSFQFDLRQGPVLTSSLFEVSSERHLLVVTLPALCADMTTVANLADELRNTYADLISDGDLEQINDSDGIEYIRIAEWQNEMTEEEGPERAYWFENDFSELISVTLPFENKSFTGLAFEPDSLSVIVNSFTVDGISALVQRYQTSTSHFILACWQLLLWRLTGQADIVVGAGSDGRNYDELQGAFGPIAKYLPIRSRLDSSQKFDRLLRHCTQASEKNSRFPEYFSWEHFSGADDTGGPGFFPFLYEYQGQSLE